MNSIIAIARQFAHEIKQAVPLGQGLINDTYLISTTRHKFVLQRLNKTVFKQPEQIIANLRVLNQFVATQSNATVQLQLAQLLTTLDDQDYYCDSNHDYWRALNYIENSYSLLKIKTLEQAAQIGFALGHFHRLLSALPLTLLQTPLPEFHITPVYLQQYQQVIATNKTPANNAQSQYCAEFITRYQYIAADLEQAKQQGLLIPRVIHGDPKADNFLFQQQSQHVISLIDLDTVQAGLVHYDIGDCLRSCCQTTAGEFNVSFCRAILHYYLREARHFFTTADYNYLYQSMRLLPFELGLRFYSDYLQGNRYFKVTHPEQNLQRAVQQFQCCYSVLQQEPVINKLLADLCRYNITAIESLPQCKTRNYCFNG